MEIDRSAPFGARVHDRLTNEQIAWLTTVGRDGTPHPRPVWFLWDGETFLVYSQSNTAKLAHIARNPRVALNLNSDSHGGDVIIITGSTQVDESVPRANQHPAYVEKYRASIQSIGMTPESFAASYNVAVRIIPEKLSGH